MVPCYCVLSYSTCGWLDGIGTQLLSGCTEAPRHGGVLKYGLGLHRDHPKGHIPLWGHILSSWHSGNSHGCVRGDQRPIRRRGRGLQAALLFNQPAQQRCSPLLWNFILKPMTMLGRLLKISDNNKCIKNPSLLLRLSRQL